MNCPASFTPLMVVDSSAEARTDAPLRPQVEITVDEARAALATMAEASPDHAPLARLDDHATDAILTAVWLRTVADRPELWAPRDLTPSLARTEGWTFGVP